MPRIVQKPNIIVDCTLPCESFKPKEDRIVWKATALSSADRAEYDAELLRVDRLIDGKKQALNALIRRVAVGWENYIGADGAPAPFTDEVLDVFSDEEKVLIAVQLPTAAGWGDIAKKKLP